MSGPPDNIESHDLWAKIVAMPRPHKFVDFPRKDASGAPIARVAVWVLSQEEQIAAAAESESFARKRLKELPKRDEAQQGYEDLYRNAAAVEVLWRACRHPEDLSKPFFPTPHQLRKLSVDEVSVLLNEYLIVQEELGPIVARMTEGEMEDWIRRLKEGGDAFPFAALSLGQVKALLRFMADQIPNSLTVTSLPGLQPHEAIENESNSPTDPEEESV